MALSIARLLNIPWVADFRDPWARAPWREDRFAFERQAWGTFERIVIQAAQTVVFVTSTNRDDFARQYRDAESRLVVVPNGCDPREFEGVTSSAERHGGRFVLLHAGSLYGARNPAALFQALASAIRAGRIDRAAFRLRFIGRLGAHAVDLPRLARELDIADVVEFASHMPRRDSLQEMVDATALLVVQPLTTVSIPAKLYEYMAAGRPILALAQPGGETAELVTRSRAGISVLADDESAIEDALVTLIDLSRDGFVPVDRRVYDGEERAAELQAILKRAAAERGQALAEGPDSRVAGARR